MNEQYEQTYAEIKERTDKASVVYGDYMIRAVVTDCQALLRVVDSQALELVLKTSRQETEIRLLREVVSVADMFGVNALGGQVFKVHRAALAEFDKGKA